MKTIEQIATEQAKIKHAPLDSFTREDDRFIYEDAIAIRSQWNMPNADDPAIIIAHWVCGLRENYYLAHKLLGEEMEESAKLRIALTNLANAAACFYSATHRTPVEYYNSREMLKSELDRAKAILNPQTEKE